jgi:endonuclease/exonuclease/phosphatase family metal-dependent hydrolase
VIPRLALVAIGLAMMLSVGCGSGGEDALRITVIDQNILHGMLDEDPDAEPWDRFPERLPLLADELARLQPEIIFLQEVNVTAADDYVDVRATLTEALGEEYTLLFGDITGAPMNEGALGQMTVTRLPVISSENKHIGGVRAVSRVTVQTDEGVIDLYNAHLEGTDETDPQVALDEIATVMTFIEESRTPGAAAIIAGDFNALPADPAIRAVVDAGFLDVLVEGGDATCEQAGDPGCTNSAIPLGDNPEHLADRRIDYIFARPGEDVSLSVDESALFLPDPLDIGGGSLLWVSDHIGVRTVLEVEAEE